MWYNAFEGDFMESITTISENRFLRLLLPYLNKRGITIITEEQLSKKLLPYYENEEYKQLFQNISKYDDIEGVNIGNALYLEKNYWRCIKTNNNSKLLYLQYGSNYNTSFFEKDLDKNIIELLNRIADEFQIRKSIETNNLLVYGMNPNQKYTLIYAGVYSNIYHSQLITDGIITESKEDIIKPNDFSKKPSENFVCREYFGGIRKNVLIKNANYAIIQQTRNGEVEKADIYSQTLDIDKLKQLHYIATHTYNYKEEIQSDNKPFVKRLELR